MQEMRKHVENATKLAHRLPKLHQEIEGAKVRMLNLICRIGSKVLASGSG